MRSLMVQPKARILCATAPGEAQDLWRNDSTASSFISKRNMLSKSYFSNNAVKPLCPPKAEPT